MKFIWDDGDRSWWCGTVVQHKGVGEKWIVGFNAANDDARYVMISLRDGMVGEAQSAEGMARMLNDGPYIPCIVMEKIDQAR